MALYSLGREVYVKDWGVVGVVIEAHYEPKAVYVVEFPGGGDYMCGSANLRAHDYECDGCGGSRSGAPHASHPEAGWFCWLCAGPPAEREERRLEMAAAIKKGWL